MTKTNREKSIAVAQELREEIATVIELSEEDTDLVGGGPEVVNDPTNE